MLAVLLGGSRAHGRDIRAVVVCVCVGGGGVPVVVSGEKTLTALGQGWPGSAGARGSLWVPGCRGSTGDTGPPGSSRPRSNDGDCFGGICSGQKQIEKSKGLLS